MSKAYKNTLKKRRKMCFLDKFCVFFGPWNYVSKTLRGTGWGVQNSAGQICLQYLPRRVFDPSTFAPRIFGPFNLCPAEFRSNATCAPRNFGDIVSGTNAIPKIIEDSNFLYYFKVIFVNLWHFRDLYHQYDHFLRKKYFAGRYL